MMMQHCVECGYSELRRAEKACPLCRSGTMKAREVV